MLPDDIATTITAIHHTPHKLVLAIAGAGSLSLFWLHSVAGSSRTVLEAIDAYAATSLAQLVERAVSVETAQAMADWAFRRARQLAEGHEPLLGVACTAAIATDRDRRGQDRCIVAVQSATERIEYELVMRKGATNRLGEEALCSRLIVHAIAAACGVEHPPLLPASDDYVMQPVNPD
jgi:hypothetical protein